MGEEMATDLKEYWSAIRRGSAPRRRNTQYPDFRRVGAMSPLSEWVEADEHPSSWFVVVPGPYKDVAFDLLDKQSSRDLHSLRLPRLKSDVVALTYNIQTGPTHQKIPLVQLFLQGDSFVARDELLTLVDQRSSFVSDLYRVLIQGRLALADPYETPDPRTIVRTAIAHWIDGGWRGGREGRTHVWDPVTKILPLVEWEFLERAKVSHVVGPVDYMDVILFLLTLARQNGMVHQELVLLNNLECLEGKAEAEDLYRFISAVEHWGPLGSPLRVLLGWRGDADDVQRLRELHPRLLAKVRLAINQIAA